ncbi:unnamed protein product [Cyprideis torosa]|uniref:Uncharacterized protein n=1 Tax=Cyprideis torosa TaxID=163714 RepID=A0A7R8WW77_9CRUS|nr:unnamed protein product [Cyprideis torosa]CAG0908190.1 unnamed protein product [Cyprideis torosa]
MRFGTSRELKYHQRTHEGETPLQRFFCEKVFNEEEQTHSPEERFECPVCDLKFGTLDSLEKHFDQTHAATMETGKALKAKTTSRQRVGELASVYAASVMEYLTAEVLDICGQTAKQLHRKRLTFE